MFDTMLVYVNTLLLCDMPITYRYNGTLVKFFGGEKVTDTFTVSKEKKRRKTFDKQLCYVTEKGNYYFVGTDKVYKYRLEKQNAKNADLSKILTD